MCTLIKRGFLRTVSPEIHPPVGSAVSFQICDHTKHIQQIRKICDLMEMLPHFAPTPRPAEGHWRCLNPLDAAVCIRSSRICALFSAWRPGSPGGQQVWLLPPPLLLSSSASLLPVLLSFSLLETREHGAKTVGLMTIYLEVFHEAPVERAHSPCHIVSTSAQRWRARVSLSNSSLSAIKKHMRNNYAKTDLIIAKLDSWISRYFLCVETSLYFIPNVFNIVHSRQCEPQICGYKAVLCVCVLKWTIFLCVPEASSL